MTLEVDIQAALETALLAVTGVPALDADGIAYTPVVGTPYMTAVIVPLESRPSTMGDDNFKDHEGLFMVTLVYPSGKGMGEIVTMAHAIKNAFQVSTVLTSGSTSVRIRYAERMPHRIDPDWIRLPISIAWYIFSTEN